MWHTTAITLSTAPVALLSTMTTWADTKGASNFDTVPFSIHNPSTAQQIRWGGVMTTASVGFPLLPAQTQAFSLVKSDQVWGMTTAGEVTVNVVAGRQTGGQSASDA